MQYLYNDHISGVKIEVQKLYSIKVISISTLNDIKFVMPDSKGVNLLVKVSGVDQHVIVSYSQGAD